MCVLSGSLLEIPTELRCMHCYLLLLLLLLLLLFLFLLLLGPFIAFAQVVLNAEIFLLGKLQLVPKDQEDAFTLHV